MFLTATKIKKMCNKAADNYPHALKFVPKCHKIQKVCDEAADILPSTIKFVFECFMTREMFDEVVNIFFWVFDSIPD